MSHKAIAWFMQLCYNMGQVTAKYLLFSTTQRKEFATKITLRRCFVKHSTSCLISSDGCKLLTASHEPNKLFPHGCLLFVDLLSQFFQLLLLFFHFGPFCKLCRLIIQNYQISSTHIETTQMVHCCFRIVYIFVNNKRGTAGILVLVSQSYLVDGTVLSKDSI